jgi:peroxiredoxin
VRRAAEVLKEVPKPSPPAEGAVMKLVSAVAAFLLVAAPALAAAEASGEAKVGQPAPSFSLKDESGKVHSLSQYKGKVVVLEWTNPECPFVQRHYQANTMANTLQGFDPKQVVWLAVDSTSTHSAGTAKAWKQEKGFGYPVLLDTDGATGHAYGAKTTPHMYVIDAQGVLRYAGAIDSDPRGSEKSPTNHVKTAVDAVLGGKPVPASTTKPYGCSVKYKAS